MQLYHFSAGNSSDGPVGFCANIRAESEEAAVTRLLSLLPADGWDTDTLYDLTPEGMDRKDEYLAVYFGRAVTVKDIDDVTDNLDPDACQGCGRVEPMGVHFFDCTLLEPGDMIAARGRRVDQPANGEEDLWVHDPEFRPAYRITQAPPSYDGFGTHTVEWLAWRWKDGPQMRRVAIAAEHLLWQTLRYSGPLYVAYDAEEWAERQWWFEPIPEHEAVTDGVAPGGACILTAENMATEDDCTTHEHEEATV